MPHKIVWLSWHALGLFLAGMSNIRLLPLCHISEPTWWWVAFSAYLGFSYSRLPYFSLGAFPLSYVWVLINGVPLKAVMLWSNAAGICLFCFPLPIFWLIDIFGELFPPPLLLITIMARVAIFGGERRPLGLAPSSNQCKLCRFVPKCLAAISFAFFISFLHCLVCW